MMISTSFKEWLHTLVQEQFEGKNLQPKTDLNHPFQVVNYTKSPLSVLSIVRTNNHAPLSLHIPQFNSDSFELAMKNCIGNIEIIKEKGLADLTFANDVKSLSKILKTSLKGEEILDSTIFRHITRIKILAIKMKLKNGKESSKFQEILQEAVKQLEKLSQHLNTPELIEETLNFYYEIEDSLSKEKIKEELERSLNKRLEDTGFLILEADLKANLMTLNDELAEDEESKAAATERIKKAFQEKAPQLDLTLLNLNSLPKSLGMLKNLKTLKLTFNNLSSIPQEIIYLVNLKSLELSFNNFSRFPLEISHLKPLKELSLVGNKLFSIAPEINRLTLLKKLNLSYNPLTSVPVEISCLKELQEINLSHNQLFLTPLKLYAWDRLEKLNLAGNMLLTIPSEIRDLRLLKEIDLSDNNLSSIPSEISQLNQLENLDLSENNLRRLPRGLGNLTNLKELNLKNNPNLMELPLNLVNLRELIYLEYENTGIPPEIVDALSNLRSENIRRESTSNLSERLRMWTALSKDQYDLSALSNFDENEQRDINEWLNRLQNTKDFKNITKDLAEIVCNMLSTLNKHQEFKNFFLMQIQANNESCEDRAAMALNELYTSWALTTIAESSLQEKLAILKGVARTHALRQGISSKISKYEKETKTLVEESVEIYLYYETRLREELGLISAIQNMSYTQIGKREWIKKKDLIETVEETYLDQLVTFDAFKQLVKADQAFINQLSKKMEPLEKEQESLDNLLFAIKNKEEEFRIGARMGEIMKERNIIEQQEYKKWYESHQADTSEY